MVIFHSYVNVYQRAHHPMIVGHIIYIYIQLLQPGPWWHGMTEHVWPDVQIGNSWSPIGIYRLNIYNDCACSAYIMIILYIYIYYNVYVSMRVSVIHTQSHTRAYIYIFAYECVPSFPVIVLWCRIPCPSILRSHPWIACIHPTVSDTEESVCRIHRWWTGHQVAGKWSSNGGRSCRHPLPRISETSQFLETSNWRVPERNRGFDWGKGIAMLTVDPRWGGIGCDMWNDATQFWCGTSLTSQ